MIKSWLKIFLYYANIDNYVTLQNSTIIMTSSVAFVRLFSNKQMYHIFTKENQFVGYQIVLTNYICKILLFTLQLISSIHKMTQQYESSN